MSAAALTAIPGAITLANRRLRPNVSRPKELGMQNRANAQKLFSATKYLLKMPNGTANHPTLRNILTVRGAAQ